MSHVTLGCQFTYRAFGFALQARRATAGTEEGARPIILVATEIERRGPREQEFFMPTSIGRFGPCSELVAAAVFLACDAASLLTGQVVALDGGFLASVSNR